MFITLYHVYLKAFGNLNKSVNHIIKIDWFCPNIDHLFCHPNHVYFT